MILAMGFVAVKLTGPDQPPIGLWIGMVVFFIVCCIPLWMWRNRLNRNQEKVSIIRSPILWWKSQPVYSNFLLILLPGLFFLVFIIAGLDTTGFLNGILAFLLVAYVVASVLYLSWDLLVKRKLHKKPVFWGVIGVPLIIYLFSIIGTDKAQVSLEKVLQITGNTFDGSCQVGNAAGDATINFNGEKVSVNYSVIGYSVTESGVLENLKLVDDGENNTYCITGDWNNQDAGDGYLRLEVFGADAPNTIYVAIEGSSWKYYANMELSDEDFNEFITVLRREE